MDLLARRNRFGVSVNESALCRDCAEDKDERHYSWLAWNDAEDTDEMGDSDFYPVDNEDARCNGCHFDIEELE